MKNFTWWTGCVAIALAAFVSCPKVSFAFPDCTFGGAFKKPLPFDPATGGCLANASLKTLKSLNVSPAFAPFFVVGTKGMSLKVNNSLPSGFFAPGTFNVDVGGHVGTVQDITKPITIDAYGDLRNTLGFFWLISPEQPVRLRARGPVKLTGDPALFNPSTYLWGSYIKVISTLGTIVLDNVLMVSSEPGLDLNAPKGDIVMHDTTLFSIEEGGNRLGQCRFQVNFVNGIQVGKVVGLNDGDTTNVFICIPIIRP